MEVTWSGKDTAQQATFPSFRSLFSLVPYAPSHSTHSTHLATRRKGRSPGGERSGVEWEGMSVMNGERSERW